MQIPNRLDWRGVPVRHGRLEAPLQLGLPFHGKTIDVDKLRDPKHPEEIEYWGKAIHIFDDIYHCLANVGGTLCVVEVTIKSPATEKKDL